jgi:hypothetical protein
MPDQRSVMKEFRYLDEKRLAEGLTPDEEARLAHLRDLIGPELGAGSMRPGFDVNAAAAALRESLLPAGLRNRPPPTRTPPPVPAPAAPPPEEPPEMAAALASVYEQAPFAPIEDTGAAPPVDPLFDPSSLGVEQPAYDPNAYAADPNAWGADPNAYAADPSAYAADPNAYPADPNAAYPADAGYDPNAQPAWDPNQPWDPNDPNAAYPADPNAYPADPNAAYPADPNAYPADPNAAYPADPNAYPADPNAAYPADPNAYPADPNAQPAWDPNQPWDPNVAPDAQAYDPNPYPADPAAQPAWDAAAGEVAPGEAADAGTVDATGAYADAAYGAGEAPAWDAGAPEAAAWDAPPEAAEPAAEPLVPGAADALQDGEAIEEVAPLPGTPEAPMGGSFAPGEAETAVGWDAEATPPEPTPGAEFGEYDAAGAQLAEAAYPGEAAALDAGAELAPAPEVAGAVPDAPVLGEYDDTAGFAAPAFDVASLPPDAPLDPDLAALAAEEPPPELGAPVDLAGEPPTLDASWQPETALAGGFELASGGSFGAGADAAAPEWAQTPAPPPWQDAPPLELGASPDAPAEDAGYEITPAATYASPAAAGVDLFGAPEGDLAPEDDAALLGASEAGTPELDFSHPDFSGGEEPPPAPEPGAEPDGAFDAALAELPPEEAAAEGVAAPEFGFEPTGGAPEADLTAPPAEEPPTELAPPAVEELAAAEAVAFAGVDAGEVAELQDATDAAAPPPVEVVPDLAFDVSRSPAELSASEASPLELSFEVSEEASAAEPVAFASSGEAAVPEEDIPTIDGADILEEIIEEVPTAPPQSLDFEPLAPEPAAVLAPPPPPPAAAPPPPPPVAAVAPAPSPAEPGDLRVPGSHRVVVHTIEGLVKRGVLDDPDLFAPVLSLAQQPGAPGEEIAAEKVKAIFFMLSPGEKPPAAEGRKVRVTFRDGRQIAGFSPDYRDDGIGFFMIPADTKTNTGRIWVFRAAVRQLTVS